MFVIGKDAAKDDDNPYNDNGPKTAYKNLFDHNGVEPDEGNGDYDGHLFLDPIPS
jgi:hypothetical protein